MNKKHISVGELQFGMYIAELDRPWTETPFMFQGFHLRTDKQLEALRKFCKHVFVDSARSDPQVMVRPAQASAASATAPGFRTQGTTQYPEQSRVENEIGVCAELYAQTYKALRDMLQPPLDGAAVVRAINRLADSVVRNPDALLLMSKMRNTEPAAHARALQVAIYMMVFGRFLQLEREQIQTLGLLGLLQDVGKTRLPAEILQKPEHDLNADESGMLKRHVELSAHILGVTSGLPPKFAPLALLHHERQDGKGYPRGLKGYQIGLYGAIAAICDGYDALLAPAPFGEGRSPSAAVSLLLKDRGTAYHGPLVEQFIRCMGSFPVGTLVELTSGEIGVVVAEHLLQRIKPKVMLVLDRAGLRVPPGRVIDMAENRELSGGAPYRIRRALEQSRLTFDPRRLFS
jgi:HD-GYP domain-containing protein (c-di-GMP phosphodiesterase class II)